MDSEADEPSPLLGRWAPNLNLTTERGHVQVADLLHSGKGVLLDVAERPVLAKAAVNWSDRVNAISARCYERPRMVDAMLIRPDGYTAWVGELNQTDQDRERGVTRALSQWLAALMRALK